MVGHGRGRGRGRGRGVAPTDEGEEVADIPQKYQPQQEQRKTAPARFEDAAPAQDNYVPSSSLDEAVGGPTKRRRVNPDAGVREDGQVRSLSLSISISISI